MNPDRPTPEQLAEHFNVMQPDCPGSQMLAALRAEGYVIVHPDDIPSGHVSALRYPAEFDDGWNACRTHIFGTVTP